MKYSLLFFLIAMVICFACEDAKYLPEAFDKELHCELKEFKCYPVDSLGSPNTLYTYRDYIIISDPNNGFLLSSYNVTNRQYGRFLKRGNGPNELVDVQQILQANNDGSFIVKGTNDNQLIKFSIKDSVVMDEHKLEKPKGSNSLYVDQDNTFSSNIGEHRFSIINQQTDVVHYFGEDLKWRNLSQQVITQCLQGKCTGSSKRHRFAWFAFYGDAYEIYDYSDVTHIVNIAQFIGVLPQITVRNDLPVFDLKSKIGVTSIAVNEKYIFAIYNGKMLEQIAKNKNDLLLSHQILVYDWDGKPIVRLNTNHAVRALAINNDTGQLFCLGVDTDTADYRVYTLDITELN